MASLSSFPARAKEREVIMYGGKFVCDADSDVTSQSIKGVTVSQVGTTAGSFLFTLEGKFTELMGLSIQQVGALAATNMHWNISADAVASAGTFTVDMATINTPQTAAEPGASGTFLVSIWVRNSE